MSTDVRTSIPPQAAPRPQPTGPAGPAGRRPPNRPTSDGSTGARQPTATGARLAARFAALFCEVEAGLRPRRHLEPLMSPLLYARASERWVRSGQPGVILRVHGTAVSDDVYEAVAVVRRGARVGAIAVRLVRRNGRWRVDDVARPEDGPLPPAPFPVTDEDDHVLSHLLDDP